MVAGGRNKRAIRIIESGGEYISQEDCARTLGFNVTGINAQLRGRIKSYKKLHFEYIDVDLERPELPKK